MILPDIVPPVKGRYVTAAVALDSKDDKRTPESCKTLAVPVNVAMSPETPLVVQLVILSTARVLVGPVTLELI